MGCERLFLGKSSPRIFGNQRETVRVRHSALVESNQTCETGERKRECAWRNSISIIQTRRSPWRLARRRGTFLPDGSSPGSPFAGFGGSCSVRMPLLWQQVSRRMPSLGSSSPAPRPSASCRSGALPAASTTSAFPAACCASLPARFRAKTAAADNACGQGRPILLKVARAKKISRDCFLPYPRSVFARLHPTRENRHNQNCRAGDGARIIRSIIHSYGNKISCCATKTARRTGASRC